MGVSARVSVIVYNTKLLSPSELPTSVMSSTMPKWAGNLGLAPSETDFQPIITAVVHTTANPSLALARGLKKNAGEPCLP